MMITNSIKSGELLRFGVKLLHATMKQLRGKCRTCSLHVH